MERRGLFLLVVCTLAWCTVGNAAVTNLNPGESVNLSNYVLNPANKILVGDKLFDDWNFVASGTTNLLTANAVALTAISNSFGFGIRISAPFFASGNVNVDYIIDYSVTVSNAPFLISDAHLDYNGFVVNAGHSSVTETFWTGGFGETQIDQFQVFNPPPGNSMTNIFLDTPVIKLYIEKDIQIGGFNEGDSAQISIINQVFSQVAIPEPSSMMLVAAGLGGLWVWRRRRK